ncbi:MAG TPA: UbiA family prenyltransferase, partial [Tabrizicola sp.]
MSDDRLTVLAVDLDGTLLRSDMLFESFWSALGRSWSSPFSALAALTQGRAALKRHLAEKAVIDAETLPYDAEVIAYVERWRANGGRSALVTATDQTIADSIAAHLGIFDEVHGSDGQRNLKAAAKADFLEQRFGRNGFAYMGDARADLAVWERAAKAVTVNAGPALRQSAERVAANVEHLRTASGSARAYLKALRPHQWLKNLLVFLPMLASHRLDAATLLATLLAFAAFSCIASSVYVLNDLLDLAADRAHPRKRNRPFASGRIPLAHGTWMGSGLILLGGGISALLGPGFLLVMLGYLVLTTAYSLTLK